MIQKEITPEEPRAEVQTEAHEPAQTRAETPQPDPVLLRRQNYQQSLQQINGRIMELKQQKSMIEDEIMAVNNQAQQIIGAMKEIDAQQEQKG